MDLRRFMPINVCSFSSIASRSVFAKSASFSSSWSIEYPEGWSAIPRLSPPCPVEKTKSSSRDSEIFLWVLLRGIKTRSLVRIAEVGRKMAFPVRLSA
jgi:hypothetical protein